MHLIVAFQLRQLCVSANEEEPRPRIRCSRRPRASCRMGPASAERSPTSLPPLAGRLRRPPAIVASPSTSLASPSSGRWHGRLPRAPSTTTYEDDNATSCTCHCLPPRWWHRLRGTACSAELGHTTSQHPRCRRVALLCVCLYDFFLWLVAPVSVQRWTCSGRYRTVTFWGCQPCHLRRATT